MRSGETIRQDDASATGVATGLPAEVAALLQALDAEPGHSSVLRAARDLARIAPADGTTWTRLRVGLVATYTIKPLDAYLTVECARIGVASKFYLSEYGHVEPDLLAPGSPLDAFDPDITFIALGLDGLQPRDVVDPEAADHEAIERLVRLVTSFRARARGPVVVHNIVAPSLSPSDIANAAGSPAARIRRLNLALAERLGAASGVHLLDMDAIVAEHGRARRRGRGGRRRARPRRHWPRLPGRPGLGPRPPPPRRPARPLQQEQLRGGRRHARGPPAHAHPWGASRRAPGQLAGQGDEPARDRRRAQHRPRQ